MAEPPERIGFPEAVSIERSEIITIGCENNSEDKAVRISVNRHTAGTMLPMVNVPINQRNQ